MQSLHQLAMSFIRNVAVRFMWQKRPAKPSRSAEPPQKAEVTLFDLHMADQSTASPVWRAILQCTAVQSAAVLDSLHSMGHVYKAAVLVRGCCTRYRSFLLGPGQACCSITAMLVSTVTVTEWHA